MILSLLQWWKCIRSTRSDVVLNLGSLPDPGFDSSMSEFVCGKKNGEGKNRSCSPVYLWLVLGRGLGWGLGRTSLLSTLGVYADICWYIFLCGQSPMSEGWTNYRCSRRNNENEKGAFSRVNYGQKLMFFYWVVWPSKLSSLLLFILAKIERRFEPNLICAYVFQMVWNHPILENAHEIGKRFSFRRVGFLFYGTWLGVSSASHVLVGNGSGRNQWHTCNPRFLSSVLIPRIGGEMLFLDFPGLWFGVPM